MIAQLWVLLVAHWFADFVLQTHWQASNKSKNNLALTQHVAVYTGVLFVVSSLIIKPGDMSILTFCGFILFNGAAHWVTDYYTSRMTSKQFGYAMICTQQNHPEAGTYWHNFFVIIGLDQLIHQTTLIFTLCAAVTYG